ncbi:TlpA family protein disulfide reductase [Mucilaginibacter sp. FT3.2]|uniref:TlpA family protein disulfide reductase n=1 Tax=Mucilaginibacter sp. FT3.2 TaxID=2723090 RepID=UPI00161F6298|nr:TlpA disulfide reductase family protein [Mucilaginibacter sp. FT3.2]MBB6234203.1 thiol-disulfide isomerase/thioredoxin [Mucilaginibacter sp. FT3.2]
MKRFLSFLAMLCFFLSATAQENIKEKGLKVGDTVPDVVLENVLNNNGQRLKLSDFKGKLLIIDFWATSCGGCIQAMPRLDSLVDAFGGKLVVLPVTAENGARIAAFQHANTFLKGQRFRTVVDDKVLHTLFPHRMLPHEAWIDSAGKVLGFTEASDVTGFTVAQALAGKGLASRMKEDVMDYDRNKALLVNNNGGSDTAYQYRSVITGMLQGLPSNMGFSYDTIRKMTIVRATNVSAKKLYALAYQGLSGIPANHVDMGPVSGLYGYELDLPTASPGLVRRSIREDLDRFFGVRSEFTGSAFRLIPAGKAEAAGEGPLTL